MSFSSGRPLRLINLQTRIVPPEDARRQIASLMAAQSCREFRFERSGTDQPSQPSLLPALGRRQPPTSYSTLLQQIEKKDVSNLELIPGRREVQVTYRDGRRATVAVFANDQQILRAAEASGTPLTVRISARTRLWLEWPTLH